MNTMPRGMERPKTKGKFTWEDDDEEGLKPFPVKVAEVKAKPE